MKALMAVDLDGTYLKCNSLRVYLKAGLKYTVAHLRLIAAAKVATLMALRALKIISHSTMKWGCCKAIGRDKALIAQVGQILKRHTDPRVQTLIDDWNSQGKITLLATAAPSFYISEIWSGDFVATDMDKPEEYECRGKEKLKRVIGWAAEHECKLQRVVTDHTDDLPLIEANRNGENIMVSPTELRFL